MFGFFLEFLDAMLLIGIDDTKAMGIFPGDVHHRNGQIGLLLFVKGQHFRIIHLIDVIAGKDQDVFGIKAVNKIEILINGIGGAGVPAATFLAHIGR